MSSNYKILADELLERAIKDFNYSMRANNVREVNIYDLMGGESDVIYKDADGSAQYGKIQRYLRYTSDAGCVYNDFEILLDNGEIAIVAVTPKCGMELDLGSVFEVVDCVQDCGGVEWQEFAIFDILEK